MSDDQSEADNRRGVTLRSGGIRAIRRLLGPKPGPTGGPVDARNEAGKGVTGRRFRSADGDEGGRGGGAGHARMSGMVQVPATWWRPLRSPLPHSAGCPGTTDGAVRPALALRR
jgi:hypothetical protein